MQLHPLLALDMSHRTKAIIGCGRSEHTYEPKAISDRRAIVAEIAICIRGCVIGADEIARQSFAFRISDAATLIRLDRLL